MPTPVLDAHAAACSACAGWLVEAQRLKRALRVRAADVPDLTAGVLAAVAADPRSAGRSAGGRR